MAAFTSNREGGSRLHRFAQPNEAKQRATLTLDYSLDFRSQET
jgi:hypothetical protein